MQMKRRIVVLLVIVMFTGFVSKAQNGKFQAVFIFNFYKQMEWPPEYSGSEFVIGILGKSDVKPMLETLTTSRSEGGKTRFVIKQYNSVNEIGKCNMLYVPSNESSQFNAVLSKLQGTSTLIITESDGLGGKGASVNFVKINQRYRFELNEAAVRKSKILVSDMLKTLAILI